MATLATSPVAAQSRSGWLWQFLRDELEPYPERVQLAGRMVLTATLVMLICMAYRVPYAFEGPVLALFVSRESTRATINSVFSMALGLVGGTIFVIASAPLFTTDPILHFIWVGFALFVVFFALPTVNSYIGVLMFSVMITVGLPLWDRAVPAEVNVEDTLWLLWVCILGVGVALLVELAFARMAPGASKPCCVVSPKDARSTATPCATFNASRCWALRSPTGMPSAPASTCLSSPAPEE
ncbi:MAG TPA: hypothetical protein VII29_08410 [Terriglobales bacterium]